MCGLADAETGFQTIGPLQWHPLCRSKLMVCVRVTRQGGLYGWDGISACIHRVVVDESRWCVTV